MRSIIFYSYEQYSNLARAKRELERSHEALLQEKRTQDLPR